MSAYNPRRPLLGAFINGPSAQVFTVLLRRDEVERRSQGLSHAVRMKLLDDWDAMAEAARIYRERCEENRPEMQTHQPPPAATQEVGQPETALYSVEMIAFVLGRTESRVRQMLRAGVLEGVKVQDRWMITEESVSDYGMQQLLARQAG